MGDSRNLQALKKSTQENICSYRGLIIALQNLDDWSALAVMISWEGSGGIPDGLVAVAGGDEAAALEGAYEGAGGHEDTIRDQVLCSVLSAWLQFIGLEIVLFVSFKVCSGVCFASVVLTFS